MVWLMVLIYPTSIDINSKKFYFESKHNNGSSVIRNYAFKIKTNGLK